MVALQGYEGPLSWLFLHLLLVAIPAVAFFVVGRRGRLRLWQIAALVLLTALLLLPAAACVHLNRTPEAWLAVMKMHASGSPGVDVMGVHSPGWATFMVAFSLGLGIGVTLFRSSRRVRNGGSRQFATPADA